MANEQDRFDNAVASVARLGVVVLGLEHFAAKVIGHAKRGAPFTRGTLSQLGIDSVGDIKNTDMTGFSIEREAEILRQAFEDLEKLIERAIAKGWQDKNP